MDVTAATAAAIAAHGVIRPGERVLVGLSGGADSVALLHVLRRLGHDVAAAHLDHAARPGSAEDAAWIADRCRAWGVACHVETRPVPPGPAFEERARGVRLAYLAEVALAHGRAVVALGHHRDDQAETVLFRLARGAGPAGAAGMAWRRPLAPGVDLARPLLDVPREALRGVLRGWGIGWREDPTNADDAFARNRIRHGALPALEAVHPGAAAGLARFGAIAREDEDAWQELSARVANHVLVVVAPGIGEVDRGAFRGLPPAVRRRLLRLLAARMGASPPDMAGLELALAVADAGGGADLGDGWRAESDPRWLVLRRPAPGPGAAPLHPDGDQPTAPWGWRVTLRRTPSGAAPGPCLVRFAPDALPAGLAWRTADPAGDRIRPWGHHSYRTLRSWLTRLGVPSHRQESLLVLASGEDVAWVPGYGRGAHAPADLPGPVGLEMQATARFRV
jgi:tRNA(Ile)-lysidine synthase